MTPHSVHLHVKRLTLDAAQDRGALIESIQRSLQQRLRSPHGTADWTQCVASAVADALSQATRPSNEGAR